MLLFLISVLCYLEKYSMLLHWVISTDAIIIHIPILFSHEDKNNQINNKIHISKNKTKTEQFVAYSLSSLLQGIGEEGAEDER